MPDPSKKPKIETDLSSEADESLTRASDDPLTRAIIRRIRLRTEDSAFAYAIFEASAGACGYSTLPHRPGDRHRDLELVIPVGQIPEIDRILAELTVQLAGEVYVISEHPDELAGKPPVDSD